MDWIDDSFSDDDLQVLAESVTSNHRSNASRKVTGRKRQLQYKENPLKERSQYDELWVTKYSPRTISQVLKFVRNTGAIEVFSLLRDHIL